MREYDLIADWYATDRDVQTGIPEVIALAESAPSGARVLDVGCGTGIPITRTLLTAGCEVFGIDSSAQMLARFHVNSRKLQSSGGWFSPAASRRRPLTPP